MEEARKPEGSNPTAKSQATAKSKPKANPKAKATGKWVIKQQKTSAPASASKDIAIRDGTPLMSPSIISYE